MECGRLTSPQLVQTDIPGAVRASCERRMSRLDDDVLYFGCGIAKFPLERAPVHVKWNSRN